MSIILKLNEAVTDNTLRKLNEARIKISGGADKIRFDFQRKAGSGNITITSLNGGINFYRTHTGALLGKSYTFMDGSPTMYFYAELLEGEDFLIVKGVQNLEYIGSHYEPISEVSKSARILTPYDEDFFYQFPSNVGLISLPMPNITDIASFSFFIERFPDLNSIYTSGVGGALSSISCKSLEKATKLSSLSVGIGTPLTGDISDLPTSLTQLTSVSGSEISFTNEGTMHFPKMVRVDLGLWAISNAIEVANKLLVSFALSDWFGTKKLKLRGNFTVAQFDQTIIATLTGKGVTVTAN